jgi:predicted SprT family Zn-dependent metalloprotease
MVRNTKAKTPTLEQFAAYQGAFDYFNARLFDGKLPALMLNFSRKAKSLGFYCPALWLRGSGQEAAELSLNPDLLNRGPRDAVSTLVHEMCHHWQSTFGTPSRRGYHNREWANKMIEVGLHPSHTGQPGGNIVGQHMGHFIVEGGPFDRLFAAMPPDVLLPWTAAGSLEAEKKKKLTQQKTAYRCPACEAKVWGKPGLSVLCGDCDERFEENGL